MAVPRAKVRRSDAIAFPVIIVQTKNQQTKTDAAVGMRMIEYAPAGTNNVQPAAAAMLSTAVFGATLVCDFSSAPCRKIKMQIL
jgi:hypothetical protein